VKAAVRAAKKAKLAKARARAKAKAERIEAKAKALKAEWEQALPDRLPDSLCRAVRRHLGKGGHYTVFLGTGPEVKVVERPAYHTNPAGDIVYHPSAYRAKYGRTTYHCAVNDIFVGRAWLRRRLTKLAREEAAK
jgi:hypothetical protein